MFCSAVYITPWSELGPCFCDVSFNGALRESWKITIVLASHLYVTNGWKNHSSWCCVLFRLTIHRNMFCNFDWKFSCVRSLCKMLWTISHGWTKQKLTEQLHRTLATSWSRWELHKIWQQSRSSNWNFCMWTRIISWDHIIIFWHLYIANDL